MAASSSAALPKRTAARGLFALGVPRGGAPTEGSGQGRASPHQRGHAGPGTGHGRASEEETRAFGEGPSLAACTQAGRRREVARRSSPVLPLS